MTKIRFDDIIITEQRNQTTQKKGENKMTTTWQVVYNSSEYGVCLEQIVIGTRERAETIAAGLTAKNGIHYWVEDGTATAEAFKGDNT